MVAERDGRIEELTLRVERLEGKNGKNGSSS